jgi:hypothetical protein
MARRGYPPAVPAEMQGTLSQRALNRALLERQSLLSRASVPLPRMLERMGGLQAQYAPAMYVGLWSRLDGFRRDELTRALERREVVQGTLLRATIHLVSAADYWPFALGIRDARRAAYARIARGRPVQDLPEAAARLRGALAAGPLPRAELEAVVGRERLEGVSVWLDTVRVPPSGTWERRRADLYAAAEDWLGPPTCTAGDGVELLVRRYLGGFGPATRAELADWAGLPVAVVAPVLDRLELRRFRADDGAELLDLPGAPLPAEDIPAPVRFLPVWDATLLAHARRARILPEEYRPTVFTSRNPHSLNTFLVDGAVAGSWRYERGRVTLTEIRPLPPAARRELAAEADRLAAFHA